MNDDEIREARKLFEEATAIAPAPWQWFGNVKTSEVYLASVARGRILAMDFARWGMAGAQPRFQVRLTGEPGSGIMQKPASLPTDLGPQMVGSHRNDFVGIGHPVARLLAAAPELVARLLAEIEDLEGWREQCAAHERTIERLTQERDALRAQLAREGDAP